MASRGVCFFTPILGKREIALGPNTEVRECKNAKYKVGNREIANIYPVTQYRSSQSESRIITTQSSKAFVSSENDNFIFFILKQENMQKPCKVFKPLFQSMKALKCFKLYQRSAQGWRGPGQMARKNVVLMGYNLFKETTPEIS